MITNFITKCYHYLRWTATIQRFEFLLPTKYNDGTAIEQQKFDQTTQEISERFEGLTQDLVLAYGIWKFEGIPYHDRLIRIRIDTSDRTAKAFFKSHKEIWKERFQQLDLWITVHEIEVI